jgi:hypothetical protein
MKDVTYRIKALQLLLAGMPSKALYHRGLMMLGQDADKVFEFMEEERMSLLKRISELQAAQQLIHIHAKGNVVPFRVSSK